MSTILDSFQSLGPLTLKIHNQLRELYFLLLPVAFALAIVLNFFRAPTEGSRFVDVLRRAIVATILLSAFQEITTGILTVANFVAGRISDMSGLNAIFDLAADTAKDYANSPSHSILAVSDLAMAALSFLSLFFLTLVRMVMMSLYHFSWAFLCALSPLLLLLHLFSPAITANLFRTLSEIASWQIVWAVLSAMLKELPFAHVYHIQGGVFAVIIINIIIAFLMILTPIVVRVLVSSGLSSATSTVMPLAFPILMRSPWAQGVSLGNTVRRAFNTSGRGTPTAANRPTIGKSFSPPKTEKSASPKLDSGHTL